MSSLFNSFHHTMMADDFQTHDPHGFTMHTTDGHAGMTNLSTDGTMSHDSVDSLGIHRHTDALGRTEYTDHPTFGGGFDRHDSISHSISHHQPDHLGGMQHSSGGHLLGHSQELPNHQILHHDAANHFLAQSQPLFLGTGQSLDHSYLTSHDPVGGLAASFQAPHFGL